jgi:hypothetical protein
MSADLLFVRTEGGMRPADQATVDELCKIKRGVQFVMTLHDQKRDRSLKQQRLFMSLLSKVAEATGRWANNASLLTVLKIALGHCDVVKMLDGENIIVARSIAFNRMPQSKFAEFFKGAIQILETEVFPGIADMDEFKHICSMLDGDNPRDEA